MNTLEQAIILRGTQETIINELKNRFNGKSTIQGHQLTVYVFIHTSVGLDLDVKFVALTNEMIQEYFGGTSIILKIGEIPFDIEADYYFKMIVHYTTIYAPHTCINSILQTLELLWIKQSKLIKYQEYEKAYEIRYEIKKIKEKLNYIQNTF